MRRAEGRGGAGIRRSSAPPARRTGPRTGSGDWGASAGRVTVLGMGEEGGLTQTERDILALERRGFPRAGAKERAIREELGLAPARYYQLLNALLDDPRALAHDPVTVNRLRRVRDARRAGR